MQITASFTLSNGSPNRIDPGRDTSSTVVNGIERDVIARTDVSPTFTTIPPVAPVVYSSPANQSRGSTAPQATLEPNLNRQSQDDSTSAVRQGTTSPFVVSARSQDQAVVEGELTPEEQEIVDDLQARDAEVRAHEQAHKAVAGSYAGAISYSYQTGPDGRQYAVGGEVPIDVSPVPGDPEATIEKMRIVKAAATAPADPSAADLSVAAAATQILLAAQAEAAQVRQAEVREQIEATSRSEGDSSSANTGRDDIAELTQFSEAGVNSINETSQASIDLFI